MEEKLLEAIQEKMNAENKVKKDKEIIKEAELTISKASTQQEKDAAK